MIQMNGQKYIKLIKHQIQVVVNMREYITDQSSGKLHPTKKGIILSLKDWQSLKKEIKTVNQLLQQLGRDDKNCILNRCVIKSCKHL